MFSDRRHNFSSTPEKMKRGGKQKNIDDGVVPPLTLIENHIFF